jgi:hypothetical protein
MKRIFKIQKQSKKNFMSVLRKIIKMQSTRKLNTRKLNTRKLTR